MAGAYCAACAFLTPSISLNRKRMKLLVSASSSTPEKPIKHLKRKNHLRPKILKTSTKPYPAPISPPLSQETLPNPVLPVISPEIKQHELPANENGDICAAVSGEDDSKVDEFRFSETSGGFDGGFGNITIRSVIKYGFLFLGAFVFQTICAVWVLGNANSDKRENSDSGEGKVLLNGNERFQLANFGPQKNNMVYVDNWELKEKIEEIRTMARNARKSEKKDFDEDSGVIDESLNFRHRTGIEKEVGGRLKKLQKRLNSDREKSLGPYANYLGKSQKGEAAAVSNRSDSRGNGTLVFEKKFKFRSPSTEIKKSAKGFGPSQEKLLSKRKKGGLNGIDKTVENGRVGGGAMELYDRVHEEIHLEVDMEEDDSKSLVPKKSQNGQKTNVAKEMGDGIGKTRKGRNGIVQGTDLGRSSIKVANSGASRKLGEDREIFSKEDEKDVIEYNPTLSVNGGQRNRKADNKSADCMVQVKRLKDMWWLNLPYVLVVLMRRVSEPEGPVGFYTLKISSEAHDQDDSAYTVAFEDRGDANNFCFLLESFFEDLGDFRADIVPLSGKELYEAVNSNRWKVIVIRKGQLQLYAGQPLSDVEMAIQSLVQGNQID